MSTVLDAPAATGTRIAELTRDGVTLRLSVTDGQPWIALERANADGTITCVGMPLERRDFEWLRNRVRDLAAGCFLPSQWQELEP